MIKKIFKKVQGFSPVELVIMVGFGALAAAALIFLATSPQYMASGPTDVNVNIKVESASMPTGNLAKAASEEYVVKESVAGGGFNYNVWPTGNSVQDLANVRTALTSVRDGGFVRLKATDKTSGMPEEFEFGNDSVEITKSVQVVAEANATINGGKDAFKVNASGATVSIEGVTFDGATHSAVWVNACQTATIQNNTIKNAHISLNPSNLFDYLGSGVLVQGDSSTLGQVSILNNSFDLFPRGNEPTVQGMFRDSAGVWLGPVTGSPTARIAVKGNNIVNGGLNGINVMGTEGAECDISSNTVVQRAYSGTIDGSTPKDCHGVSGPFFKRLISVGIATFYLYDPLTCTSYNPAPVKITNNTITGTIGIGIGLDAIQDSQVTGNKITMAPLPNDGYSLGYNVAFNFCRGNIPNLGSDQATINNTVANNTITGKATNVFRVSEGSYDNDLTNNDIGGLTLYTRTTPNTWEGYRYWFGDSASFGWFTKNNTATDVNNTTCTLVNDTTAANSNNTVNGLTCN